MSLTTEGVLSASSFSFVGSVVRPVNKDLSMVCTPKIGMRGIVAACLGGQPIVRLSVPAGSLAPETDMVGCIWSASGRRGMQGPRNCGSLDVNIPVDCASLWLADWVSEALTRRRGSTVPSSCLQITESPAEGAFTGLMDHETGECWSVRSPPG